MSDNNLKLKVKSELKIHMPNKLFLELIKEMGLSTSLGKNEVVDSVFKSYSSEEVKDMIIKKYDESGSFSRSKERFLNTINRKSVDERSKLKNKEKQEKKRQIHQERIRKNKEKQEKREKELEEQRIKDKLKEKELEDKRKIMQKQKEEEAKRLQEQKKKIQEEKKREEERQREIQRKRDEERRKENEKKRIEQQKKREEKKRMKELIQNSPSNLKLYHANCTDIYFIYDYIKSEIRKGYINNNTHLSSKTKKCVEIDQKLIDYKYENSHTEFFTDKLLEAIKLITIGYFKDKNGIALLAVPPSKMEKDPQTKKSIDLIEEWCKEGEDGIDFKFYNKSKFLIRTKDVESSKEGNRDIKKHENSIECDKKDDMPSNIGAIILDDITTSGNTMYVCKNKLIGYGLDEEAIIPLAIARTINPYNEIYDSSEGKYIVYDENVEELK